MKIIAKLLVTGAAAAVGALASIVVTDRAQEKKEKKEFEPYGTTLETEFGRMTAITAGEKGPNIVVLNGYGSPSPYLEFKPLMKELSRFSKVTVLEPLGYGCSDNTERPRTIDHITEELDAALNALNIQKCWLMPHSIAGVYSLAYVNMYPEKVEGILAIDPSHPEQIDYFDTSSANKLSFVLKQLGLLRLTNGPVHGDSYGLDYEAHDIELMKKMYLWHTHDQVQDNEAKNIRENMNTCRHMSFPEELPILMMLASENVTTFEDWWKPLHEKQIAETKYGKLVELDGTHFLHLTQSAQIAETSRKYIRETLIRKLEEAQKQLKK
ncbi:MAG: alpha/beta hydrolase [Erysipelotrichaceae bacterium]|nr:alpha/beta hydrolase [Erysipelotrichaceae bacterium]